MAKTASRTAKTSAKSKAASPKKRSAASSKTARKVAKKEKLAAGDQEITIDRRRPQSASEVQDKTEATAKPERRKKVQRRRQIDPTTCERDYSDAEVEFMNAMDEYKRTSGRMFPTCSEVLEVLRTMGYEKLTPAEFDLLGRTPAGESDVEDSEATEDKDAEKLAAC